MAFTAWQLVVMASVIVSTAGSVVFAVWLTTHDLGNAVSRLTTAVERNTTAVRELQIWRATEEGRRGQ